MKKKAIGMIGYTQYLSGGDTEIEGLKIYSTSIHTHIKINKRKRILAENLKKRGKNENFPTIQNTMKITKKKPSACQSHFVIIIPLGNTCPTHFNGPTIGSPTCYVTTSLQQEYTYTHNYIRLKQQNLSQKGGIN